MVYTAIHETGNASGIGNDTTVKTPMEATKDAGSVLRCDHTCIYSYIDVLPYILHPLVSL